MKNIFTLCCALIGSTLVMGQETTPQKTQIEKEVKVEEKNGEKVLTIETRTNGTVEKEVYRGAEADAKLAELEKEAEKLQEEAKNDPNKKVIVKKATVESDGPKTKVKSKEKSKMEVQKEVSVEEKDGVKTVVVTTTKNGQVTTEVFRGEEAEKVLEQLEKEAGKKGKKKQIEVEVEEQ